MAIISGLGSMTRSDKAASSSSAATCRARRSPKVLRVAWPDLASSLWGQRRPISMTDTRSDTVSVVERTHAVEADGAVFAAHFLGRTAVFVLGEEAMVFAEPDSELRRMAVH